jgi:hemoglobin-like flavoprotein
MTSEIISRFYADLFERISGVRRMFPADMTTRRERLLAALVALVHSGHALAEALARLGRDHRKMLVYWHFTRC